MSSAQGRFASSDPFLPMIEFQSETHNEEDIEEAKQNFYRYLSEPQHWNRYSYVINRPTQLVDLDGRLPVIAYIVGMGIVRAGMSPAGQAAGRQMAAFMSTFGMQAGRAMQSAFISMAPTLRGVAIEAQMGFPSAFRYTKKIDNFVNVGIVSLKSKDVLTAASLARSDGGQPDRERPE